MADEEENYLLHREALDLFTPFDKNQLHYHTKKKKSIRTIEGATERDTRYNAKDILAVRQRLIQRASRKGRIPTVDTDWMYPSDLPAALALDYKVYQEPLIGNITLYDSWLRKNNHITVAVFDHFDRSKCLAYIGMMPLPEQIILDIIRGKRDELNIQAEEILTYDEPGDYTILADSVVTHPDHPELVNRMLSFIVGFWYDQYPTRRIKRIYARAVSDSGQRMIKKLFLGPLYSLTDNGIQRVKDAYVLDMDEEAASRIVREFQQRLKSKE
jgi:hypothetical protein